MINILLYELHRNLALRKKTRRTDCKRL